MAVPLATSRDRPCPETNQRRVRSSKAYASLDTEYGSTARKTAQTSSCTSVSEFTVLSSLRRSFKHAKSRRPTTMYPVPALRIWSRIASVTPPSTPVECCWCDLLEVGDVRGLLAAGLDQHDQEAVDVTETGSASLDLRGG